MQNLIHLNSYNESLIQITGDDIFRSFQVALYEQWKMDVLLSKHYNIQRSDILEMPFYELYYKIKICEDLAKEEEERNKKESKSQNEMMNGYKMPEAKLPSAPSFNMPNISIPSMPSF